MSHSCKRIAKELAGVSRRTGRREAELDSTFVCPPRAGIVAFERARYAMVGMIDQTGVHHEL